jgi:hypothetical protein
MRFEAVPQGLPLIDLVTVASPLLRNRKVSRILQIANDLLYRSFSDPHLESDIAQPDLPVSSQAHKDMTVVTEKSPITHHNDEL